MYTDISEAMVGLSVWKKNRRTSIKPLSKNIAYKPTFDTDYYRESALYRFIELVESSIHLYRANHLIGAIVLARAAQESFAVLWYINTKLGTFVRTKDLAQFRKVMSRLTLGWSNDVEFPEKINVFDCIDSVDKSLEGKFRKHYEMLCEYAHPNYSGTFGAYGSPNEETLEVTLGEYPRQNNLKKLIETTLIICLSLLETVQDEYEEVINSALDICHELHKNGTLEEQL